MTNRLKGFLALLFAAVLFAGTGYIIESHSEMKQRLTRANMRITQLEARIAEHHKPPSRSASAPSVDYDDLATGRLPGDSFIFAR